MTKMVTIVLLFFAVAATASPAVRVQRQLPCTHPLRMSYPEYFAHCESTCTYSDVWGDWEIVEGSTHSVATIHCSSGEAFNETRTKLALGNNCTDQTETRRVCMPSASERLVITLGLGSTGRDYASVQTNQPASNRPQPLAPNTINTGSRGFQARRPSTSKTRSGSQSFKLGSSVVIQQPVVPNHCPRSGRRSPQVCNHITGKRSADSLVSKEEEAPKKIKPEIPLKVTSNISTPIMQFSWEEHAHRIRRQTRQCDSDDTQHVLFVLDSSGSIRRSAYTRMKNAIAELPALFCKRVKFGLMTFSSELHLDFCFNCFENTYSGREGAANAIRGARYQSGLTYTGEAVRCICDEILGSGSRSCGIGSTPSCLDVVFVTDGHSNGNRDVCREINCLHGRLGVNTYAIGINGYNQAELDCISNGSDRFSTFEFDDFDDFEAAIRDITLNLLTSASSSGSHSCAALSGQIRPDGGVPFQ